MNQQSWRQRMMRPVFRLSAFLFQLQDDEVPRVLLMFFYSLLAVGTFILGRIVRDALFLSLPEGQGARNLPMLMAVSAVCVSAAAYLYSRVANRLRRDRMILLVNMVLALLLMILYACIVWMPKSATARLFQINYVYVEVMGSLQVILFWTLASELFDPRAAKRIFAIIGGGAVMANLLAFGVRPMVTLLSGTEHMLPILALMMVFCMGIVFTLGQESKQQLEQGLSQRRGSPKQGTKTIQIANDSERIWSNRHLTIIALVVVVTFLTTSIIDYQFKVIAAAEYRGHREGLSHFFSMFYGMAGILACVVQFFLANRILQSSGIRRALLLLPLALFVFSFSLTMAPMMLSVLWAVTLAKGSENVLRYTINDVSMNLLYVPVDSRMRARAKAFIDGILKPGAILVAALVIEMLRRWTIRTDDTPAGLMAMYQNLSWVAMGLLGVWVVLVVRAHHEYVSTLINSMEKSGLDLEQSQFSLQDESAVAALRQVLHSDEPRQVLHALEMLRHVRVRTTSWIKDLVPLLESHHTEIRMAALVALSQIFQQLRSRRSDEDGPWSPSNKAEALLEQKLFDLIESDEADIRARAIELLCVLLQEEAISPLLDYLEDNSPEVRAATIVGLIRFGGLDGILHAATHLKDMLENDDPELRSYGARIIGRLETRSFYQPLRRLMLDSDLRVRQSAIEAAGRLCNLKLIPDLLEALTFRETSQWAGFALARYGDDVLSHLAPFFDPNASLRLRFAALRVVSLVGGEASISLIEPMFFAPERRLRLRTLKVLQRFQISDPNTPIDRLKLHELLEDEFKNYYQWSMDRKVLSQSLADGRLLDETLEERCEAILETIFEALSLLYPRRQIQLISHHLHQTDKRMQSHAIELLDNMLNTEIKRWLLPILEPNANAHSDLPAPTVRTVEEILSLLLADTNPWMCSCALWTIGLNRLALYRKNMEEALARKEPMVRETALIVSRALLAPEEYRTLLQRFVRDPSPLIVRFVKSQLHTLEAG